MFLMPLVFIFPILFYGGRMQHVRAVDAVLLIGAGVWLGVALMQIFRR